MSQNKRIQYIDALRGLTMILVVYGHVCTKLMQDASLSGGGKAL